MPQERPGPHSKFPAPIFCPKDNMEQAREGHLADLTYVKLPEDGRWATFPRLPYVGEGWYAKPAAAYMLEKGIATWSDFAWSLDATAHVDQESVTQALQQMEAAWPEGEEHYAKLSINALIGLWARNMDLIYTMRTSNHQFDGSGCQHRELFLDAAGGMHWDHIYVTQLLSNRSCRPVHDFVMASEYVAVCRIRDALAAVPSRYLKAVKTDCVVFQDLPKKFQRLVDGLVRERHPDGTPVHRCEEVKGLEGQYRIPRIEAKCPYCSTVNWKVAEDPVLHCLEGGGLLLTGYPGTGKTYLARQIVTALREEGYKVKIITKTHSSVQNFGMQAETADHWARSTDHTAGHGAVERHRLRLHEPQNQVPAARRLPPVPRHHGQLRGHPGAAGAQALPAAPRPHRRLAPRAHGEHEERPGHLRLPDLDAGRRAPGAAPGRGAPGGPGTVPAARRAGRQPRHLPRPHQRPGQPPPGPAGSCHDRVLRHRPDDHQHAANHAGLARPEAHRSRRPRHQGHLRARGRSGPREDRLGRRRLLHPRRPPEAHQSALDALQVEVNGKSTPASVDLKLANHPTTAAMNSSIASANNATLATVAATYALKSVDVDQRVATALLSYLTQTAYQAGQALQDARLDGHDTEILALQSAGPFVTAGDLSNLQVTLQSAIDGILAEIATLGGATNLVNAPAWLGNVTWDLLAGTNQIRNLHATGPLSIQLANDDWTLSFGCDAYTTQQTDDAIAAALTNYFTRAEVTATIVAAIRL